MQLNKLMQILLPALLTFSLTSQACTALAITDEKGGVFHGRTLEYTRDLPSWLTYYPVGTSFQKKAPDGSKGAVYQAKYAILSITTPISDGDSRDIVEGLNSAGLSFSENMMIHAELAPLQPSKYQHAIPVISLGEWALAQFSTVDEVKKAVQEGNFWSPTLSHFSNMKSPFHYAFYDKKGGSIVIEASNGRLHVYDNPTRVMTNGPEFPWHLTNLNNYTHLTNEDRSSGKLGNMPLTQPDSGIAVAALPSSDTSVDRFIRGVYYTTYTQKTSSTQDSINTLAHIMSRFDRPINITVDMQGSEGEKNTSNKPVSEYSVWTALSDLNQGVMWVRGYHDINYQMFSLKQYQDQTSPVFTAINIKKSS